MRPQDTFEVGDKVLVIPALREWAYSERKWANPKWVRHGSFPENGECDVISNFYMRHGQWFASLHGLIPYLGQGVPLSIVAQMRKAYIKKKGDKPVIETEDFQVVQHKAQTERQIWALEHEIRQIDRKLDDIRVGISLGVNPETLFDRTEELLAEKVKKSDRIKELMPSPNILDRWGWEGHMHMKRQFPTINSETTVVAVAFSAEFDKIGYQLPNQQVIVAEPMLAATYAASAEVGVKTYRYNGTIYRLVFVPEHNQIWLGKLKEGADD